MAWFSTWVGLAGPVLAGVLPATVASLADRGMGGGLRSRLQRGVNRLMYGERDDPYAVISHLGRRLEATLVPESVLPTIAETIAQALKLPYAAILLKEGEGFRTAAERSAGVGLSSMRERASELGGSCVVQPTREGGTKVLIRLHHAKE